MSNSACQEHPLHEVLMAAPDHRLRVLLALRIADGVSVAAVQRQVLDSLDGTTFEILRQPENFPVLALRVGEAAFCRLAENPLVQNIQQDRPERSTGT